jgi:hypothetical protein
MHCAKVIRMCKLSKFIFPATSIDIQFPFAYRIVGRTNRSYLVGGKMAIINSNITNVRALRDLYGGVTGVDSSSTQILRENQSSPASRFQATLTAENQNLVREQPFSLKATESYNMKVESLSDSFGSIKNDSATSPMEWCPEFCVFTKCKEGIIFGKFSNPNPSVTSYDLNQNRLANLNLVEVSQNEIDRAFTLNSRTGILNATRNISGALQLNQDAVGTLKLLQ